jgi:hypothetical protein
LTRNNLKIQGKLLEKISDICTSEQLDLNLLFKFMGSLQVECQLSLPFSEFQVICPSVGLNLTHYVTM